MTSTGLDAILVDGVLLTREALAAGIDEKQLRRLVRAGLLVRIHHGAYADSATWANATVEQRHRLRSAAILRRYDTPVALSHQSAVLAHGGPAWGLDLDEVHLTHLRGGGRREAGVRHHRGRCDDPDDLVMLDSQRVTGVTRTVLDIAATCGNEAVVVVASHFLHRRATTRALIDAGHGRRREWPGTLAAPIGLSLADGRLESVGESRCWYLFWQSALPLPVPQVEVCDGVGVLVGRVDFLWPEWGVAVEFDGREKYMKYRRAGESILDAVLRERRRESRIIEIEGWDIIRLDWADLAHPEEIVRRVLEAVARRQRAGALKPGMRV